jgi:hypothetical protein
MEGDGSLDPDTLTRRAFTTSFRGADPKEVKAALGEAADAIRHLRSRCEQLGSELAEARAQAASDKPAPSDLDQLVADETAAVLAAARNAATEIRSKAEESAARIVREATDESEAARTAAAAEAAALRQAAESVLDEKTKAAEAEAERIRAAAHADAEATRAEAASLLTATTAEAEATRSMAAEEAELVVEQAKAEGKSMVAEAKAVRGRMLDDLGRKRDALRAELARLTAGRDTLLAAYDDVRRTLDEVTDRVRIAGPDARIAVEAGRHAGVEQSPTTAADIEREIEMARDLGHPFVPPTTAEEPQPEAATEPEPELAAVIVETATAVDVDGDGVADLVVVTEDVAVIEAAEPVPPVEPDPVPEPPPEPEAALEPEVEEAVDDLFARIRASRADQLAKATEVLQPEPDAEPEVADAEDDPLPEGSTGDEEVWSLRADQLAPIERVLAKALKRHLADEQNVVLDNLRRSGSDEELLPPLEDHRAAWAAILRPYLAEAAGGGAGSIGSADAEVDVSELADAVASAMIGPFRLRVERAIEEVGSDPDALDARLRVCFREQRTHALAVTTGDGLLAAYALGQYTTIEPGSPVRWLVDPAQGPCPDAHDNALAGEVPKGAEFPTGDRCPQAHPGCRCLLALAAG